MKFKIKEKKEEECLRFYLEEIGGKIILRAEDKYKEWWNILSITKEGKLILHQGLIDNLDLKLDKEGRIKLE